MYAIRSYYASGLVCLAYVVRRRSTDIPTLSVDSVVVMFVALLVLVVAVIMMMVIVIMIVTVAVPTPLVANSALVSVTGAGANGRARGTTHAGADQLAGAAAHAVADSRATDAADGAAKGGLILVTPISGGRATCRPANGRTHQGAGIAT